MGATMDPDHEAEPAARLRSAAVAAETVAAAWAAVADAIGHSAPGAATALFLRCSASGLWQQVADAPHSRIAIAKTFAAARPALGHSEPLVRWASSGAYLPLHGDAGRLTGCVVLAFEGTRELARSSEAPILEAVEVLAAALDRIRRVDDDRLARRWRVAVQTLPRLAHAATGRDDLLHVVRRTIEFVFPGARAHLLLAGEGGALHPFTPTGAAAPCPPAVRQAAGDALHLDKLQLSRPASATILGPSERQLATAPLHDAARRPHGALAVEIPLAGRVFDLDDLQPLSAVADIAALALDRLETTRTNCLLQGRDAETGCHADASLLPAAAAMLDRALATSASTALLLLRVDAAGAEPDPRLAVTLGRGLVAAADAERGSVFRVGPLAFAVLTADCSVLAARQLAHRLRLVVRGRDASTGFTASVGLAVAPLHAVSPEALREAAEAALDLALAAGPDADAVAPPTAHAGQQHHPGLGERHAMLLSMARLVDELHFGGRPHADVVAASCREVATLLGLDRRDVETAGLAGELHAVGRALLPVGVFGDGGPAALAAGALVSSNVVLGGRLVATCGFPRVGEAIAAAYESWDGSGTPNGLRGEAIPVVSRVLAAVEAYERTRAEGTGRDAELRATRLVAVERGRRFDPRVVDVLLRRAAERAGDAAA